MLASTIVLLATAFTAARSAALPSLKESSEGKEDGIVCPLLTAPAHGKIEPSLSDAVKIGTTAHFSCNATEGYQLIGSSERVCKDDGTWSGEQPSCTKTRSKRSCGGEGDSCRDGTECCGELVCYRSFVSRCCKIGEACFLAG